MSGYGANTTATYQGRPEASSRSSRNGSTFRHPPVRDYLGVHWNLADDGSPQHGTDGGTEVPGAISGRLSRMRSKAAPLIFDHGWRSAGVERHLQWQLDGEDIAVATGASYLPTENDEGHALTVNISFTDALGQVETSSASAGTVAESPTENATIVLMAWMQQQRDREPADHATVTKQMRRRAA